MDWSPDGEMLATAGREGKITLWNSDLLTVIRTLPAPEWVVCVRFSLNGRGLYYVGGKLSNGRKRWLEVFGIQAAR